MFDAHTSHHLTQPFCRWPHLHVYWVGRTPCCRRACTSSSRSGEGGARVTSRFRETTTHVHACGRTRLYRHHALTNTHVQARVGGAVTSHQDSAFLFTEPRQVRARVKNQVSDCVRRWREGWETSGHTLIMCGICSLPFVSTARACHQTCLGLWLALEDATMTNGCERTRRNDFPPPCTSRHRLLHVTTPPLHALTRVSPPIAPCSCIWGRPGSHLEPLRRRMVCNPAYFQEGRRDVPQTVFQVR